MNHCSVSYRPRRVRSGTPPPFQLTKRDLTILQLVAKHRFLNSDHIRRIVDGSAKNISNRLKILFEHGFLDRPECQYNYYRPGGGSQFIVYAPADKGMRLLTDNGIENISKGISWAHKNKSVGHTHLKHTLAIAEFTVAMRLAVRNHDNVDLIDGTTLVSSLPPKTGSQAKPYRLNIPVPHQGGRTAIGVEPDYVFSLSLTKEKRQAFFMVEVDRGTMPVARRDLRQTSILRKLLAYQALWQSKQHQQHFGWCNFRVLFVTTSAERVENMISAANKNPATKGSPLFLFTDKHSLYAHGDVLTHEWSDSHGSSQALLPSPATVS